MTAIALYVPEDREIDLSALSPGDYEMVKGLRGAIHRSDNILLCQQTSGDRELFVFRSATGAYFAKHFPGGAHGDHHIARVTDEHLRGTDCWLTAWSRAGIQSATEVGTNNRVRLDAVAFGGRVTALEVQVSPQTTARVKGRHTQRLHVTALTGACARQLARPMEVVWFAPVGRPEWLHQVPTVECRNRSWETTPDPRTVPAIGPRRVDLRPCQPTWFPHCPVRGSGWCGKPHAHLTLRGALSLADVAEMVPAGELVPITVPGQGVYLASPEDAARYGSEVPAPKTAIQQEESPAARATRCAWDGHTKAAAAPAWNDPGQRVHLSIAEVHKIKPPPPGLECVCETCQPLRDGKA